MTLRRSFFVKGRDDLLEASVDFERVEAACQAILDCNNGDWSNPWCQHYCYKPECCGGQRLPLAEKIILRAQRMTTLFMQFLFQRLGDVECCSSKWWTLQETEGLQAFGHLCSRIMPRVMLRSLQPQEVDVNDDEGLFRVAWKIYAIKKNNMVIEHLEDPQSAWSVSSLGVLTMPLDKLSNQAQHLDGNGRASLVHLVRDGGMSHRCADTLCRLTLLVHNWASTLLAHFEDAAWCYIDFQDRSAELSAMHWVRSIVVFSCWPYPLLASHLMTEVQRRNLWDLFLAAPMCCLDEDFGYPLQQYVLSRPGGVYLSWRARISATSSLGVRMP